MEEAKNRGNDRIILEPQKLEERSFTEETETSPLLWRNEPIGRTLAHHIHTSPILPCASPVPYSEGFYNYFWALSALLFFLKAQILRTVFNSETYSVSSPGACIFAGPGVPPISWNKLSQRLEASQPAVLPPDILLLPA